MTLLTICQDAADEVDLTQPANIIANTASEAQKLYRYANKVGSRMMKAVAWQALRKERTFTGLATEAQAGILPSDFDRFIPETFWDRTNKTLLIGPIGATEWQGLKTHSYNDATHKKFIHRGGSVSIIPTLSGGESLAFEYVSNAWALSASSVAQTKFLADLDTSLIDEELITYGVIFEYLDGEGFPSQKALVAYQDRFSTLLKNDQPRSGVMMVADIFGGARRFNGVPNVSGSVI